MLDARNWTDDSLFTMWKVVLYNKFVATTTNPIMNPKKNGFLATVNSFADTEHFTYLWYSLIIIIDIIKSELFEVWEGSLVLHKRFAYLCMLELLFWLFHFSDVSVYMFLQWHWSSWRIIKSELFEVWEGSLVLHKRFSYFEYVGVTILTVSF